MIRGQPISTRTDKRYPYTTRFRSPDVVELMRGTDASGAAARTEIEQLLSLPSGYHRDLQVSKGALFHGFGKGLQALALLPDLLQRIDRKSTRLNSSH